MATQGQQEPDDGRGTGGKIVGVGALVVGYQTGDGVPVRGWDTR